MTACAVRPSSGTDDGARARPTPGRQSRLAAEWMSGSALLCAVISQPPPAAQKPQLIRVSGSHGACIGLLFEKQWSTAAGLQSPARTSSHQGHGRGERRKERRGAVLVPDFSALRHPPPAQPLIRRASSDRQPWDPWEKTYHPLSATRDAGNQHAVIPIPSHPSCFINNLFSFSPKAPPKLGRPDRIKEARYPHAKGTEAASPSMSQCPSMATTAYFPCVSK